VFALDDNGSPLNIEVRPSLPIGFHGCENEKFKGVSITLPAVGEAWRTRFGVISAEEAATVPVGSRGNPYPGQKPLSETEALSHRVKSADGKVDEATVAALDAAAAREAAEKEANKSCKCLFYTRLHVGNSRNTFFTFVPTPYTLLAFRAHPLKMLQGSKNSSRTSCL